MKLYLIGHDRRYAAEQTLLTLFPKERPEYSDGPPFGDRCELRLSEGEVFVTCACRLVIDGATFLAKAAAKKSDMRDSVSENRLQNRIVKLAFYRAALKSGVPQPQWGALTGVRPAKLLTGYLEEGLSQTAAVSRLRHEYFVSPERARLCLASALAAESARGSLAPRDICLYVGIPFCPTRCDYCSFVSQSVEKSMALVAPYLDALMLEIRATGEAIREAGLRVVSVYMGGGTPTTLSAPQLSALCGALAAEFDLSALREYTVEAGRPDTISEAKLRVLREHGVTRVSVNPQTMENSVLDAIGRRHTAEDILQALALVRSVGGFEVNMDLIAGLTGDSLAGFSRTLDKVLALAPENITVHTLSLKKGSRLISEHDSRLPSAEEVGKMLDLSRSRLCASGYAPYYLYRQKFMSGGFENVGWCLPLHENLYNICIMEELCGIISLGAGGSTKLPGAAGRIRRMTAPKFPHEYISAIAQTCGEKAQIKEFYNGL
ncbi:MAG: coproporphyrinogen dehydrogenase HemZ [Oscillospiraceae bacterium]